MDDHTLSFEAERAAIEARLMFQRMLTGWAMDVLTLRKQGLDAPSLRAPQDNFRMQQPIRDAA